MVRMALVMVQLSQAVFLFLSLLSIQEQTVGPMVNAFHVESSSCRTPIRPWHMQQPNRLQQRCSRFLGTTLPPPPITTTTIRSQSNRYRDRSLRSFLCMHMGHSHSHHHHHSDPNNNKNASLKNMDGKSKSLSKKKRRRQIALVLFCALAILGPRLLLQKRMLRFSDVAFFSGSALILASADRIRQEVQTAIGKVRLVWRGVAKHSPPLQNYVQKLSMDEALRVTVIGVILNLILSVAKVAVGITSHSSALIADAGHSLSDLFSDFVTLYTVQIARLPPDDDHPYGHGKFEAIGSLFLALMLLATGVSVGVMSNKNLIQILGTKNNPALAIPVALPESPALFMAAISIFSKEWLFRITRVVGQRLNSQVVMANAWHHRSDAYSSVLALISIGLAMTVPGMLAADSFAGILVAGMICMTGGEIMGESIKQLSDTNNEELVSQVSKIVTQSPHVQRVDHVRARQVGSQALVDVRLTVAENVPTDRVEEQIRTQILHNLGDVVLDAEVRALSAIAPATVPRPNVLDVEEQVRLTAASMENSSIHIEDVSVQFYSKHSIDNNNNNNTSAAAEEQQQQQQQRQQPLVSDTNVLVVAPLVSVQVKIRLGDDGEFLSISEARKQATALRIKLEEYENIAQAKIFLDLNDLDDRSSGDLASMMTLHPEGIWNEIQSNRTTTTMRTDISAVMTTTTTTTTGEMQ